jgi:hypothetical protein
MFPKGPRKFNTKSKISIVVQIMLKRVQLIVNIMG